VLPIAHFPAQSLRLKIPATEHLHSHKMLASYTRSLPSTRQLTTSKPQQTPSCSRHLFAPSTLSPLIYPHQHSSTSQALKTRARSSRSQSRQVTAMVQSVRDVESSENVLAPCYTKDDLSTGIVHFGIGNFARSHQVSLILKTTCSVNFTAEI
jgi:hypothetical protein